MKIRLLILSLFLAVLYFQSDAQTVILEPLNTTFDRPVDIKHAGEDRLYIVEKIGRIQIMDLQGNKFASPFLDITAIVNAGANERGLLGLAFHPDFETNGYFYVNYTGAGGHTRISRFTRSVSNPDSALASSEKILLLVNQPFSNHNAGDLAFGPDGYLYIGLGDGGSGGDPGNRSQNPEEYLGKMLRIDVDNGDPYAIPADNPFTASIDTLPEIWALGLRNPWRISFDRLTGDFWIADVGQDKWEEIDFQPAGSPGGRNYGWRCYEGYEAYNTAGCGPQASYEAPIHVYENVASVGCSVTGGYVYRGAGVPSLFGKYVFTDFCTGWLWTLEPDGNGGWTHDQLFKGKTQEYVAFGEDVNGELYLAGIGDGTIYKFVTDCALTAEVLQNISPTCFDGCDGVLEIVPDGGCMPYSFALSNGMTSSTGIFTGLCGGVYDVTIEDCAGCISLFEVIISEPELLVLLPSTTRASCFGRCDGELILSGMGGCQPYSFEVKGPDGYEANSGFLVDLCAGEYAITITDCAGCLEETSVTILQPDSLVVALFVQGDTIYADQGFIKYIWFNDGQFIDSTTSPFWVPDTSGIYVVEVIDSSGCSALSEGVVIEISSLDSWEDEKMQLRPNPFSSMITATLGQPMEGKFELRDVHARPVAIWEGPFLKGNHEFNGLDRLPEGLYFFIWIGEDGSIGTKRVVKSGNSF